MMMMKRTVREVGGELHGLTSLLCLDMPVFASEVEMLKNNTMVDEHGNPLVSGGGEGGYKLTIDHCRHSRRCLTRRRRTSTLSQAMR